MKERQIAEILKSTGIPLVYYMWPEDEHVPDPPYLVYYYPDMRPEAADDRIVGQIRTLNIELYSNTKDTALEARVEEVLKKHFVFSKEETFISDENLYEVLYMTEVFLNEN